MGQDRHPRIHCAPEHGLGTDPQQRHRAREERPDDPDAVKTLLLQILDPLEQGTEPLLLFLHRAPRPHLLSCIEHPAAVGREVGGLEVKPQPLPTLE